jgi:hypothetical protein
MTTRTTAVDHPSRRPVVALPQTYDEARERYESLIPEVDFGRFSEMASWQATLELAHGLLAGLITSLGGDVTAFLDADRETV